MKITTREKWEAEQRELGHALHGHYRWIAKLSFFVNISQTTSQTLSVFAVYFLFVFADITGGPQNFSKY